MYRRGLGPYGIFWSPVCRKVTLDEITLSVMKLPSLACEIKVRIPTLYQNSDFYLRTKKNAPVALILFIINGHVGATL